MGLPDDTITNDVGTQRRETPSWSLGAHYIAPAKAPTHYEFKDADGIKWKSALCQAQNDIPLQIKKQQVASFQIASLPYMDQDELRHWQYVFREAFLLAVFRFNHHRMLKRKQKEKDDLALLYRYQYALEKIDFQLQIQKGSLTQDEASEIKGLKDEEKSSIPDFLRGPYTPSVAVRDALSEFNWYRLYWVWAGGNGGLLAAILTLPGIKKDLDKEGKLAAKLDLPLSVLGYLSWTLYFTRFLINFFLILKHLIPGSWMTEAEKKLSKMERLNLQWEQRKFSMMNDLVWGTVNLVTFYWLTGNVSQMAGAWGGVLTVGLMLFDVYLAHKELREEKARFENASSDVKQALQKANRKLLDALSAQSLVSIDQVKLIKAFHLADRQSAEKEMSEIVSLSETVSLENCRDILFLNKEKESLEEEKALLEFDWYYKQKQLNGTLFFNSLFVPVMAMIVANALPYVIKGVSFSLIAASSVTVVGGILAVMITAAQTYYKKQQEIDKLTAQLGLVVQKKETTQAPLEMARLTQKENYLASMIQYERRSQIFSVSMQIVFAAAVFGALLLPTPIGLGVLGAVLLVALVTKIALKQSKPEEPDNLSDPTKTIEEAASIVPQTDFFKPKKKSPLPVTALNEASLLRVA